jgi:hypothetical protein
VVYTGMESCAALAAVTCTIAGGGSAIGELAAAVHWMWSRVVAFIVVSSIAASRYALSVHTCAPCMCNEGYRISTDCLDWMPADA